MDWKIPLDLKLVRAQLEADPGLIDRIPGNLSTVGIVSGYRVVSRTPDFQEVQFEVSQGHDEELQLTYVEDHKSPYTLNFVGTQFFGRLIYVCGFELESFDFDYGRPVHIITGEFNKSCLRTALLLEFNPKSLSDYRLERKPFLVDSHRSMISPQLRGKTAVCQYPRNYRRHQLLEQVLERLERAQGMRDRYEKFGVHFDVDCFYDYLLQCRIEHKRQRG